MRWKAPGSAWQKACTRPEGSGVKASRGAKTTPLVPIEEDTSPSPTTPTPIAAAALSPPPAATGSPRGSPSASAAASRSLPAGSVPSRTAGSQARGISSASSSSSDQSRARTSSSSVPDASEASVARSPVRRRRTWSFGSRTVRTRAATSGSSSSSQRTLGAWNPVRAGLPATSRSRAAPTRSVIQAHCAAVRWSFHSRAGRRTSSRAPRKTEPCICPVRPSPATASRPTAPATRPRTSCAAAHQSAGSCSVQPGRGVASG